MVAAARQTKPETRFVVQGKVVGTLRTVSERRIREHAHFYAMENIGKEVFIVREGDDQAARDAGVG